MNENLINELRTCENPGGEPVIVVRVAGKAKSVVHVFQRARKHNQKHGTNLPVFKAAFGRENLYFSDGAEINGTMILKNDESNPLPCGATVWIELSEGAKVTMHDAITYTELKNRLEQNGNNDLEGFYCADDDCKHEL